MSGDNDENLLPLKHGQLLLWVILKSNPSGFGAPGSSKIVAAFAGDDAHAKAMDAILEFRDSLEDGQSLHLIQAQLGGLLQVNNLSLNAIHKGSFN